MKKYTVVVLPEAEDDFLKNHNIKNSIIHFLSL